VAKAVGATAAVEAVALAGAELVAVDVGVAEGCAELQATSNKLAIIGTINRIKSLLTIEPPFSLIQLAHQYLSYD
jgi:hypothetical protein